MTPRLSPGATLILGGARSGKSRLAERIVEASGREAIYIATGRAFDAEMEARIAEHRARRGSPWRTVEAPLDLVGALAKEAGAGRVLLVDCLTLWLTNLMLEERDVPAECDALVSTLRTLAGPAILVSNEVGLGIVPDNAMARAFRDHAGRLHQAVAEIAGTVLLVAAGLPLTLKSSEE